MTPLVPKPRTSNARAAGRFDKEDFDFLPEQNAYRCPAGEILPFRFSSVHDDQNVHIYFTSNCGGCALKSCCTTGKERRVRRWAHEYVVDATRDRLDANPNAMIVVGSAAIRP